MPGDGSLMQALFRENMKLPNFKFSLTHFLRFIDYQALNVESTSPQIILSGI